MPANFPAVVCFCLLLGLSTLALGQDRYAVFFSYKPQSSYTLANPAAYLSPSALARRNREKIGIDSLDLPLSAKYLQELIPHTKELLYTSKWLNAAVVVTDLSGSQALAALPFVKRVDLVAKGFLTRTGNRLGGSEEGKGQTSPKWALDQQFNQATAFDFQNQLIGIQDMQEAGFTGKGVRIAIFDAGFPGMENSPAFAHLASNKRIIGKINVVQPWSTDVFRDSEHGTNVASLILAYQPGVLVSGAYNAEVILALTEEVATEYPVEELNWVRAAEYADSLGVDIINSSLGYLDFDEPKMTYTTAQLDGKTTYITRGAAIASKKGILVVNSVGNNGAAGTSSLTAPADAPGILSVGSVNSASLVSAFSSRGPTADGRIKPELVAFGQGSVLIRSTGQASTGQGTSFSAPQLAALAAGLWEARPEWTKEQVLTNLLKSGSQYANPDNILGYGIPNFRKAYLGELLGLPSKEKISFTLYPNPVLSNELSVIFGRESKITVRLISTTGTVVLETSVQRQSIVDPFQISIYSLPPGLYVLQVFDLSAFGQAQLIRR